MNPCRVADVAEFEAGFMVIYGRYIYMYSELKPWGENF
jgi:hypothetical protein